MNILTNFLESNTCIIPEFSYVIKYKKNNNKTQFWEGYVKFTKYEKKNKKEKIKLFIQYEKLKNFPTLSSLLLTAIVFFLKFLLRFEEVFPEIFFYSSTITYTNSWRFFGGWWFI